jgi:ribose 5-phosphate isomerase B
MKVFISSDHAGFVKKQELIRELSGEFSIADLGPEQLNPQDDYPLFAERVARAVVDEPGAMGLLICDSGQGMEIAANKVDGVRAAVAWNKHIAYETRRDNDSNVLSLPAAELSLDEMVEIARTWLGTPFSGSERHQRRIDEIEHIEESND